MSFNYIICMLIDTKWLDNVETKKIKDMLQKGHLKNCLEQYYNPKRTLPDDMYLGFMEACLVQFGVIENKSTGISDHALKIKTRFLFWEWKTTEDRRSIILRLVKEHLNMK